MKRISLLVIVLFLFVYILPLGVRPLTLPDEYRYAEIPREIVSSGDWIVPHLNGIRYFEKPILGYWLNAAGILIFGENAFAARFFSAIAIGFSALCLFILARSYNRDRIAGILAAVIFLTFIQVFAVGTFSVLDNAFTFFVTATITCYFFAHIGENPRRKKGMLVLTGIFCGLAFLTKGFIAFAIPAIAIIPFLFWQRRAKAILLDIWLPIVSAVLVSLPWCLLIHTRETDFWHYFFWIEHVQRFFNSSSAQHPEAFWFFIPFIIGGAFPWTVLFPTAIAGLKHGRLNNPLVKYAICWFVFPFLFFSASWGKLPTYILPCFAPLAILMSIGLLSKLNTEKTNTLRAPAFTVSVIVIVIACCLILNFILPVDFKLYGKAEFWKVAFLAISLFTFAAILFLSGIAINPNRKLALFALSPILLMFCIPFIMPYRFTSRKAPESFLKRYSHKVDANDIIITDNYLAEAICWTYKRNNLFIVGKPGELNYGLKYDDSKDRLLNLEQLRELIDKTPDKKHIVIITHTRRYQDYQHLLPEPEIKDIGSSFTFAKYKRLIRIDNSLAEEENGEKLQNREQQDTNKEWQLNIL